MASKTILFLLGLTIIAVAYGVFLEEDEDTELAVEDFQEYFSPMEKRGPKTKIGCKLNISINKFLKKYLNFWKRTPKWVSKIH